ncbi:MAG: fasciclin domain-containing protein [Acidobacteria bacterium]|nr:fasciclin domain-containing protein [Acidobacteriota bacterium]
MAAVEYQDIVSVAIEAGRFSTLATALQSTGLDHLLKGTGPFTLFAPTDAAFARLPAGMLADLLEPRSRERLTAVLAHHVVPGTLLAAALARLSSVTTAQGGTLPITASRSGLAVGAANVVTADLDASNGVIHVIDSVLLPQ